VVTAFDARLHMIERQFVRVTHFAAVHAAVCIAPEDPLTPAFPRAHFHVRSTRRGAARSNRRNLCGVDARLSVLEDTLRHRPASAAARGDDRKEAAVALLLRARADLELLLIKRAEHERDPWSGHMALPGGRRALEDSDLLATAFRETEEEIAVPLKRVGHFLGALDEVAPANPKLPPLVIAPFVVAVPENTVATANTAEVDFAVWVPLASLREPGAAGEILIQFEGGSRSYPSLRYGEHVIWGLTLRILKQFFEVVEASGI